jgi:hypothetical protein
MPACLLYDVLGLVIAEMMLRQIRTVSETISAKLDGNCAFSGLPRTMASNF